MSTEDESAAGTRRIVRVGSSCSTKERWGWIPDRSISIAHRDYCPTPVRHELLRHRSRREPTRFERHSFHPFALDVAVESIAHAWASREHEPNAPAFLIFAIKDPARSTRERQGAGRVIDTILSWDHQFASNNSFRRSHAKPIKNRSASGNGARSTRGELPSRRGKRGQWKLGNLGTMFCFISNFIF